MTLDGSGRRQGGVGAALPAGRKGRGGKDDNDLLVRGTLCHGFDPINYKGGHKGFVVEGQTLGGVRGHIKDLGDGPKGASVLVGVDLSIILVHEEDAVPREVVEGGHVVAEGRVVHGECWNLAELGQLESPRRAVFEGGVATIWGRGISVGENRKGGGGDGVELHGRRVK